MNDRADTAQVVIQPPFAWGLAIMAGLALNALLRLPFLPTGLPAGAFGAMVWHRPGAGLLGHRFNDQGRLERPRQPAND